MDDFTYSYKNETNKARVTHFLEDGYNRYYIKFGKGMSVVIAPLGIRGPNGLIVWVQVESPGEISYAHDLIQAIGDGMVALQLHGI